MDVVLVERVLLLWGGEETGASKVSLAIVVAIVLGCTIRVWPELPCICELIERVS